jgi:hypothetical protein
MSPPISPISRHDGGPPPGRGRIATAARLLPILTMLAYTIALLPNSGCGKGLFPEITNSATATTVPIVTPTSTASPSLNLSMLGSGTQTSVQVGTCSGAGCGGSARHCECMQFTGSLTSMVVGASTWSASITVNTDDCTSTGTAGGFCCVGDGIFSATNGTGTGANLLALSVTGPICVDPNSSLNAAELDSSLEANFSIVSANSTGKFLNSSGTGQFNLFTDSNTGDAYLAILGEIQLAKP